MCLTKRKWNPVLALGATTVLLLKHAWDTCTHDLMYCTVFSAHWCIHVQQRFLVIPWCFLHIQKSPWAPPSCNIKETEQVADLSQSFCILISEKQRLRESSFQEKKCLWNTVWPPIFCNLWKHSQYDRNLLSCLQRVRLKSS